MKRMVISSLALLLTLSLAAGAWAAAAFPPRTLCFTTDNYGDQATLYIKMVGTVPAADGPLKIYSVQGEYVLDSWASVPVAGTGHLDPATGAFHYSVTGCFFDGSETYSFSYEDYLDRAGSPPGYITAFSLGSSSGVDNWDDTYTPGSCADVIIPYSARKGRLGSLSEALKARTEAFKARVQPKP